MPKFKRKGAAMDLYLYATPIGAAVILRLDDGRELRGEPCTANGRDDAHRIALPAECPVQGAVLSVSADGMMPFDNRGILDPREPCFKLDDVRLVPMPAAPPEPEEPTRDPNLDPLAVIQAVHAQGNFDLSTKEGCGTFTEACAAALWDQQTEDWGHIRKDPHQNNYNGHAVDAIMLRWACGNTQAGGYDIIHNSESADASPCFNWAGGADDLWTPIDQFE